VFIGVVYNVSVALYARKNGYDMGKQILSVRIDSELVDLIDGTSGGRAEVVSAALKAYFDGTSGGQSTSSETDAPTSNIAFGVIDIDYFFLDKQVRVDSSVALPPNPKQPYTRVRR
jgi:hypothetical protein